MHHLSKFWRLAAMNLLLFVFMTMTAIPAFAQSTTSSSSNGIGKIFRNIASAGNDAILLGQVGAIVVGIFLIIGGVLALVKDAKSQGNGPVSKGAAFIMIGAGAVLSFVSLLINSTAETVWGDTTGGRDRIVIPTN